MWESPSAIDDANRVPQANTAESRMYITHAVLSLDCGGLERVVVDLVRHSAYRGQHVSVLCLERPGMLAPQVERMGVPVVCLNKLPGLRWSTKNAALAALKMLQPDVVHTHQITPLLYIAPAAAQAGIQIVHTEHSNHLARASSWLRRWRYRALLRWSGRGAGRFCCVAADIARAVSRLGIVPARKVHLVPNGIDISAYSADMDRSHARAELGIPTDAPVIGTVGRLHPVKSQDVLIRAFATLTARLPQAHLIIVGEGPAHQKLAKLAQRLSIANRVHLTGYRADPKPLLNIMDVFALTSRWEGMPLAILEAWASGLPVVASAVGGIPELVRCGENGLLFPDGDETALAAAVEGLIQDRTKARELGMSGRADVAASYSLQRMTTEYERHYRELMAERDPCHCK